jgi:hypothetical protein
MGGWSSGNFPLQSQEIILVFPCLSDGVTVAQCPLEAFVMVRIHVGQPVLLSEMKVRLNFAQSLHRIPSDPLTSV